MILDLGKQSAKIIDEEKLRLESGIIVKVKQVFNNMALDAESLYKTTGNIPAQELSLNYYPEFLKEVRDAMRKSIRKFGFNLRNSLEGKGFYFDIETKKNIFDLDLKQSVVIEDNDIDEKLESINTQFAIAATLFIANQSELANDFIAQTNAKEINIAVSQEEALFADDIAKRSSEINKLRLSEQTPQIRRQIESSTRQLANSITNSQAIIAKNIKTNLLDRSQARSELIASQNVGVAESWARQTEAELIDGARLVSGGVPVSVKKKWVAILDSKTRQSHVAADFQEVGINESFSVGGFEAKYPRDTNLPASESINCRCVSVFDV